jgi:membrane associated rhomboid family serine protease
VLELYLGISGRDPSVAHFAHLGGMIGGFALILYWRSQVVRR